MRFSTFLLTLLLAVTFVTQVDGRKWTDKTGKYSFHGTHVGFTEDGKAVFVRDDNKRKITVKLDVFTIKDEEFLGDELKKWRAGKWQPKQAQPAAAAQIPTYGVDGFLREARNELRFNEKLDGKTIRLEAQVNMWGKSYVLLEDTSNPDSAKLVRVHRGDAIDGGYDPKTERRPANVIITIQGKAVWTRHGPSISNENGQNPMIVDGNEQLVAGLAALEKAKNQLDSKIILAIQNGPARSFADFWGTNPWDFTPSVANVVTVKGDIVSMKAEGNLICVRVLNFLSESAGSAHVDCVFPKDQKALLIDREIGSDITIRGLALRRVHPTCRIGRCIIVQGDSSKVALK